MAGHFHAVANGAMGKAFADSGIQAGLPVERRRRIPKIYRQPDHGGIARWTKISNLLQHRLSQAMT